MLFAVSLQSAGCQGRPEAPACPLEGKGISTSPGWGQPQRGPGPTHGRPQTTARCPAKGLGDISRPPELTSPMSPPKLGQRLKKDEKKWISLTGGCRGGGGHICKGFQNTWMTGAQGSPPSGVPPPEPQCEQPLRAAFLLLCSRNLTFIFQTISLRYDRLPKSCLFDIDNLMSLEISIHA